MSPSSASAGSLARFDDGRGAGQQPGTDPHQQLDQQRLLVGEVPVDRRTADARGGADVLQPHREITALGDKAFGRGDQLASDDPISPGCAGWWQVSTQTKGPFVTLRSLVDNSVNRD